MRRLVTLAVGYVFLALGIVGLVLPILQGVLFTAVGLIILSREAPWARRLLDRLRRRHPRLECVIDRTEAWMTRQGRRLRVRIGRLLRPAAPR